MENRVVSRHTRTFVLQKDFFVCTSAVVFAHGGSDDESISQRIGDCLQNLLAVIQNTFSKL
jgi:hypothetical protein